MKKIITIALIACNTLGFAQSTDAKKIQDKAAILQLAGCHEVTFDFAETFAPARSYQFHDRYHDVATEFVTLVENTENKIVLQHLLIISDSMIIKHWRQDWIYENTEIMTYDKDEKWIKTKLLPEQVKGQWTQKVTQVDDSPRYEGSATWLHVDGKHYWECTSDAPLPRREYTKRNDYNVVKRHNKIILTAGDGWLHEQDNQKIIRTNGKDSLLCWEKGFEQFTNLPEGECAPAIKWWEVNNAFWKDVRTVWQGLQQENHTLAFVKTVSDKKMYETLFELGIRQTKAKATSVENQKLIKEAIAKYVKA